MRTKIFLVALGCMAAAWGASACTVGPDDEAVASSSDSLDTASIKVGVDILPAGGDDDPHALAVGWLNKVRENTAERYFAHLFVDGDYVDTIRTEPPSAGVGLTANFNFTITDRSSSRPFAMRRVGPLPAACYEQARASRVRKLPSTGCDDFTIHDVRSCGDLNKGASINGISMAARAKQVCPPLYDPDPKGPPYFGSIKLCKLADVSYGTSIKTPDTSRPNVKMASVDVYCKYGNAPEEMITQYEDPELRPTGAGALRSLILKGAAKVAFFFR